MELDTNPDTDQDLLSSGGTIRKIGLHLAVRIRQRKKTEATETGAVAILLLVIERRFVLKTRKVGLTDRPTDGRTDRRNDCSWFEKDRIGLRTATTIIQTNPFKHRTVCKERLSEISDNVNFEGNWYVYALLKLATSSRGQTSHCCRCYAVQTRSRWTAITAEASVGVLWRRTGVTSLLCFPLPICHYFLRSRKIKGRPKEWYNCYIWP